MRSFWLRLRTYWRRRRLARDFDDEIAFHLEMRRERMIADGVPPEDATRAARRAFGSPLRTKEALAELWSFRWLDDLARDLLYAGRTCRRNPVFALTAVCSLALGVGAATAIYTAAYSLLWRPMPVENPDRLVALYQTGPSGFLSGETAPEAVLGYRFWQRRFNADPNVIGKQIGVNGHVLTIVGVTARGFTSTQLFNYVPDISIPVQLQPILLPGGTKWVEDRTNRWMTVRGRLKPGVSMQQAETEFNVASRRLASQYPDTNRGLQVHVLPGGTRTHAYLVASGAFGVITMVVGGAVVMLLAIVCTNVANLLLTRAAQPLARDRHPDCCRRGTLACTTATTQRRTVPGARRRGGRSHRRADSRCLSLEAVSHARFHDR